MAIKVRIRLYSFCRTAEIPLGCNKSYKGVLHGGQLCQKDEGASEAVLSYPPDGHRAVLASATRDQGMDEAPAS